MMGDPSWPKEASDAPDLLSANLPTPGKSTPDPRLKNAVEEACRVHQVTPILKEELRAAIMLRRLSSGKGEVTPVDDDSAEERNYELSSDEMTRRERRRAQNRMAARRCRNKKRQEQEKFIQVYTEQNTKRQKLEEEVLTLREEKKRLEAMLVHHMLTRACQKGHVTSGNHGRPDPSFSASISQQNLEEDSFYGLLQSDSRKDNSDMSALSNLDPELPVEEASLLYNLDSRQILSDLITD